MDITDGLLPNLETQMPPETVIEVEFISLGSMPPC